LTAEAVAGLWHRIMTEGLGIRATPRTAAGWRRASPRAWPAPTPGRSPASTWPRPDCPRLRCPGWPAEQAYVAEAETWTAEEGGYAHEQATKPATLGAALHDSPVGRAAWIGEKIVAWGSTTGRGQPAFGRGLLLAR
jgi:hypothetical protein